MNAAFHSNDRGFLMRERILCPIFINLIEISFAFTNIVCTVLFKWKKEKNVYACCAAEYAWGCCQLTCVGGKYVNLTDSFVLGERVSCWHLWSAAECSCHSCGGVQRADYLPILNCCICFTTPCFGVVIEEPWMADKYNSMYRALQAFFL